MLSCIVLQMGRFSASSDSTIFFFSADGSGGTRGLKCFFCTAFSLTWCDVPLLVMWVYKLCLHFLLMVFEPCNVVPFRGSDCIRLDVIGPYHVCWWLRDHICCTETLFCCSFARVTLFVFLNNPSAVFFPGLLGIALQMGTFSASSDWKILFFSADGSGGTSGPKCFTCTAIPLTWCDVSLLVMWVYKLCLHFLLMFFEPWNVIPFQGSDCIRKDAI